MNRPDQSDTTPTVRIELSADAEVQVNRTALQIMLRGGANDTRTVMLRFAADRDFQIWVDTLLARDGRHDSEAMDSKLSVRRNFVKLTSGTLFESDVDRKSKSEQKTKAAAAGRRRGKPARGKTNTARLNAPLPTVAEVEAPLGVSSRNLNDDGVRESRTVSESELVHAVKVNERRTVYLSASTQR